MVMAVFRYTALNQAGKQISGEMEAQSRELVIRHLAEAGHFPIDAVAQSTSAAAASSRSLMDFWQSASATQITQFTRQLAMLLGAGLTLPRAMGLIEGETSGGRVQKIAQQIRADIAVGKSLAEALEARGKQFPPVFVSMVRAAEASGTLPEVLERIAETREREQKMRAKLISALLYPSLLVVTAIAALLVIMLFVVPRFKSMLVDSGRQAAAVGGDRDRRVRLAQRLRDRARHRRRRFRRRRSCSCASGRACAAFSIASACACPSSATSSAWT